MHGSMFSSLGQSAHTEMESGPTVPFCCVCYAQAITDMLIPSGKMGAARAARISDVRLRAGCRLFVVWTSDGGRATLKAIWSCFTGWFSENEGMNPCAFLKIPFRFVS